MKCGERSELIGGTLGGRYSIDDQLGTGGTGVVFSATRLSDHEHVLIKTLKRDYSVRADLCARLLREREVATRVPHPGIVPIYGAGELEDGSPYLCMRRVYGEPLSSVLHREHSLSVAEACVITMRVADILQRVHGFGYVHRDIKPEHVLLRRTGRGNLVVMILDFGVCASESAPLDERMSEKGRVYGTPTYCSPEQASGNPFVDGRSDIFALGTMMFEMLAGSTPFHTKDVSSLLRKIIREDAPPVSSFAPQIPSELNDTLSLMLERNPELRISTMREVAHAVSSYVSNRAGVERSLAARLCYEAAPELAVAKATKNSQSAAA